MAWERAVILISTQVPTREIRELVRVRAVSHWTILREQAARRWRGGRRGDDERAVP